MEYGTKLHSMDETVTAVITTSPIPSHPGTAIIDAVYGSIRHHFPTCHILILADGVREEQDHLRKRYEDYLINLSEKNWTNVRVEKFSSFHHQAGMMRAALQQNWISTPLVLWIEHDFPLNYMAVEWQPIISTLLSQDYHVIRFCHDSDTRYFDRPNQREQFKNLTGHETGIFTNRFGIRLLPVLNMDTLPHIATTNFYKFIIGLFREAKTHVDCLGMNSVLEHSYPTWKLALYAPEGNMKRFEGFGARGDEPKYPMTF